jgi:hypothetical protein
MSFSTAFRTQLMGGQFSVPTRNGKVLFVDPNGLAPRSSNGQSFQTIQRAIDSMTTDTGSTIFIYPGSYAENLVVENINYLTLCGVVVPGYAKPDIVPTSGLALTVTASQGIVLRHMRFAAPAADTDLVLQEGNGFLIEDCVFDGDATQGNAKGLLRLKGNATDDAFTASEGVIQNCLFRGSGGLGLIFDTAEAAVGVGETDVTVRGNIFVGNDQSDIATADTGPGTYSIQRGVIHGNIFETKNKTNYIDLTTSNGGAASDQTGIISGNYFAADAINTTNIAMVGTGFTFVGNYNTVGVVDGSALD